MFFLFTFCNMTNNLFRKHKYKLPVWNCFLCFLLEMLSFYFCNYFKLHMCFCDVVAFLRSWLQVLHSCWIYCKLYLTIYVSDWLERALCSKCNVLMSISWCWAEFLHTAGSISSKQISSYDKEDAACRYCVSQGTGQNHGLCNKRVTMKILESFRREPTECNIIQVLKCN